MRKASRIVMFALVAISFWLNGTALSSSEDAAEPSRTFAPKACTGPMKQAIDVLKKRDPEKEAEAAVTKGDYRLIAHLRGGMVPAQEPVGTDCSSDLEYRETMGVYGDVGGSCTDPYEILSRQFAYIFNEIIYNAARRRGMDLCRPPRGFHGRER